MLCPGLCSWSKQDPKQDPKLRVGQDAKGAQGRGEGHRATPPVQTRRVSQGAVRDMPGLEEQREGVTSPSCLALGELLIALCCRESGPLVLSFLHGQ